MEHGFASGKEIYTFFYIYGKNGIIGIIISISLIGYIIYKSLKLIKKYEINSFDEFLKIITHKENSKLKDVLKAIINIFLLISFLIMCAGFTAYFKQEFGINQIYTGLIISLITYFILSKDIKGIVLLNSILIPIIMLILGILGIKSLGITNIQMQSIENTCMWLPKAILYASYNSITLVTMLIPMKKYIKNNKDIISLTILSSIIILGLSMIIILLLLNIKADISKIELPAVYASRNIWKNIPIFIWSNNTFCNHNNSNVISI